jgi:uncharacterized protein YoxC
MQLPQPNATSEEAISHVLTLTRKQLQQSEEQRSQLESQLQHEKSKNIELLIENARLQERINGKEELVQELRNQIEELHECSNPRKKQKTSTEPATTLPAFFSTVQKQTVLLDSADALYANSICEKSASGTYFELLALLNVELPRMIVLLKSMNVTLMILILRSLDNILACGERNKTNGTNVFAEMVEGNCLEYIEMLQAHENIQVYEIAMKILQKYYCAEEE